jgi:hypothetical protein
MAWFGHGSSAPIFDHTDTTIVPITSYYDPPAPLTVASNVPAGRQMFVGVVADGGGGSVTDSKGNTYNMDASFGAVQLWRSHITTPLVAGVDTISCTCLGFSASDTDQGTYTPTDPGNPLDTALFGTASGSFTVPGTVTNVATAIIPFLEPADEVGYVVAISGNIREPGDGGGAGGVGPTASPPAPHAWLAGGPGALTAHPLEVPITDTTNRWSIGGSYAISFVGNPTAPDVKFDLRLNAAGAAFDTTAFGVIAAYRSDDWPGPEDPDPDLADIDGVDLAQSQVGHIYRSYLTDAQQVCVDVTKDEGDLWTGSPFATDPAVKQVPTLALDRHDHLYCFYHTENDDLRVWRNKWLGDPSHWEDFLTKSDINYRHVRGVFAEAALYLSVWRPEDEAIKVYRTENFGTTLVQVLQVTASPALPEQLASFRMDRRGLLHLYYFNDSGGLYHLWSKGTNPTGPSDWNTPLSMTLNAVEYGLSDPPVGTAGQSVALGTMYGLVAHQEDADFGGASFVFLTDESYHLASTPAGYQRYLALPGGLTFKHPQSFGTLVDRRENVWVIGKLATPGFGGALGPRPSGGALEEV